MDWETGRQLYESGAVSQSELAEKMNCTQQNVSLRAKKEGWEKPETPLVDLCANIPEIANTDLKDIGKRTPENLAQAAEIYALSGSIQLAASSVGVHRNTLRRWIADSAEYSKLVEARRARFLASQVSKIGAAKDWKSAAYLLARDPQTRDQYGEHEEKRGPTIVLNIHRDAPEGVTIEHNQD